MDMDGREEFDKFIVGTSGILRHYLYLWVFTEDEFPNSSQEQP